MENIIIIGGGGHAKVLASVLKKHRDWNPYGYTDVKSFGPLLGLPYIGTDSCLQSLISEKKIYKAAMGIGQTKHVEIRKHTIGNIVAYGLHFPQIISPNSIVNEAVEIGQGTLLMDGTIIQTGVKIGEYSIINTGATIDHDCLIGDYVHVAPGAVLSGDIIIGNNVLIGTGARVIQGIHIGKDVIVGAGAVVVKNIGKPGLYTGVPARRVV